MRFWRALLMSILGYYVLGIAQVLLVFALHLDPLASSLPFFFWVALTLVTVALTFGFVHWYFRAHEHFGLHQGLLFGVFFVVVSILLDMFHVYLPGDSEAFTILWHSYLTPGFIIQVLAIIATATFVGEAHGRHRGKKKRKR